MIIPQKVKKPVIPAKAWVQNILKILDSGFRRNDAESEIRTFYGFIKYGLTRREKSVISCLLLKE